MSPKDIKITSDVKRYWVIWFLFTGVLIITRFVVLKNSAEDERFSVFCFYILITWIPLMIIGLHHGLQVMNYLEENHPEIYKDVYSWRGYAPVFSSFKMRRFIKSSEDYGDPIISGLKSRARSLGKLFITVFITIPFLFIIVMI